MTRSTAGPATTGSACITPTAIATGKIPTTSDDYINGGDGNDFLQGGEGADTIMGGAGNDGIALYGSNVSIDGGAGTDGLSLTAATTIDLSLVDQSSGDTANVTGFENASAGWLHVGVSLTGNASDNILLGGYGDDTIMGGAGNDEITGGGGADSIDGGDGDDRIYYDTYYSDVPDVLIAGGAGTDTLIVEIDAAIDLSAGTITGIEIVDASSHRTAVSLTGDANANALIGSSRADTINGGSGADTIDGGAGNDTSTFDGSDVSIAGGTGTDTLIVTGAATINLSSSDQSSGDTANVTGFEIVDASSSSAAVSLTGDANANKLTGGSGNDTITGGADADTIDGGAGNDTITFDGSDVSIAGGIGTDTLIVTGAATINLSAGNISGFEIVDASKSRVAVSITGDANANVLTGGDGDDTINGGAGNDTITFDGSDVSIAGGTGTDTLTVTGAATIILSLADQTSGDTANVFGFENVDASTSSAAVSLTGDANANKLTGGSGNDTISGGAGADTINGGAGNDTITFDGSDVSIAGGTGTDTLIVTGAATIDLLAGNISGFEIVDASTSSAAVSLTGNADANKLTGGSGNDTISGGAGADTIDGGAGNDTLIVTGAATINLSPADQTSGDTANVTGFENVDASTSSAAVSITGDANANKLTGGVGDDTISRRRRRRHDRRRCGQRHLDRDRSRDDQPFTGRSDLWRHGECHRLRECGCVDVERGRQPDGRCQRQ